MRLPLRENRCIGLFLVLNPARVLELGELSGPLLEHLLLYHASLLSVALIDLLEYIGLVILLDDRIPILFLLHLGLCLRDLLVNDLLLIL